MKQYKNSEIKFNISLFEKITGFKVKENEIIKILNDLGFKVKKKKIRIKIISSFLET